MVNGNCDNLHAGMRSPVVCESVPRTVMCFIGVWWTLWGDFGVHSENAPDLDKIFGYEIKYSAL